METHPEKEREVREFEMDFKKYFLENDTFLSEVESGFGEPGAHRTRNSQEYPRGLSDAILPLRCVPRAGGTSNVPLNRIRLFPLVLNKVFNFTIKRLVKQGVILALKPLKGVKVGDQPPVVLTIFSKYKTESVRLF